MRKTVFATFGLALLSTCGVGIGQSILSDGDFEDLDFGTAPNCVLPNGAWLFPDNYVQDDLCETMPEDFSVVPTAWFDDQGTGRSLQLQTTILLNTKGMHIPNIFPEVEEIPGYLIVVDFDIWVAEPGKSGGAVYLSGDHGGGGAHRDFDRGPQLTWNADGTLTWTDRDSVGHYLADFAVGRWQRVHLEIDLTTDTWNIDYGDAGGMLDRIGTGLGFRARLNDNIDHLDRFTYAAFGNLDREFHGAIDNISVSTRFTDVALVVTSPCPRSGIFEIAWGEATPLGQIAVIKSRYTGYYFIPEGGVCAGTLLRLSETGLQLVMIERSDANGAGNKRGRFSFYDPCRQYLQLLDLETCKTSNAARVD